MMTATKREALVLLAELCDRSPDVRLGQLLAHLGMLGEDETDRTLWDIDDEQLLSVLHRHRSELAERTSDSRNRPVDHSGGENAFGVSVNSPSGAES